MSAQDRGFTLVELLVALFITAVMFAMGYGAINQALNEREAIRERQERFSDVQRTMRILAQDFTQLAPRPVREPVGGTVQPALRAVPGSGPLVEFTRGGWSNPAGIQRPTLQRVAYVLSENTLRRDHWLVLDATLGSEPVRRELLDGVTSVRFRFMSGQRDWREDWPPPSAIPGDADRDRPIAVEVVLDLEDWGRIVRIFEAAG